MKEAGSDYDLGDSSLSISPPKFYRRKRRVGPGFGDGKN